MARIELENLLNTRDLGGIKTVDGRIIKENMLIRSGQLYNLSKNDVNTLLNHNLSLVIDFRTLSEKESKPDPKIDNVTYIYNPILELETLGISREKGNVEDIMNGKVFSLDISEEKMANFMLKNYSQLASNDYSIVQYSKFVELVVNNAEKGATLWHCTAGKDRVGIATVIILECLGVDRKTIVDDYLKTNEYSSEEINASFILMSKKTNPDFAQIFCKYLLGANEIYINQFYEVVDNKYGGMDNFLKYKLGINENVIEYMKNTFLRSEKNE